MKSIRSFSLFRFKTFRAVLLGLGMLGFSQTPAHAQTAQGTFTLPYQAQWGKTVLPPGAYTFSLESSLLTIRPKSKGGGFMVLSRAVTQEKSSAGSALVLANKGGTMFVSSLYLERLGLMLHYPSPEIDGAEMKKELAFAGSGSGRK